MLVSLNSWTLTTWNTCNMTNRKICGTTGNRTHGLRPPKVYLTEWEIYFPPGTWTPKSTPATLLPVPIIPEIHLESLSCNRGIQWNGWLRHQTTTGLSETNIAQLGLEPRASGLPCQHSNQLPSQNDVSPPFTYTSKSTPTTHASGLDQICFYLLSYGVIRWNNNHVYT